MNNSPGHIGWIKNPRYVIYVIREMTAVPLAFYGLYLLVLTYLAGSIKSGRTPSLWNPAEINNFLQTYNPAIQYIALTAAIIHSLTWFHALSKILPFSQTPRREKILTIIIIALWLSFSYLIFTFFYR